VPIAVEQEFLSVVRESLGGDPIAGGCHAEFVGLDYGRFCRLVWGHVVAWRESPQRSRLSSRLPNPPCGFSGVSVQAALRRSLNHLWTAAPNTAQPSRARRIHSTRLLLAHTTIVVRFVNSPNSNPIIIITQNKSPILMVPFCKSPQRVEDDQWI
jgi:hypothetical protein